jgi:hypothetical protein
MVFSLLLQFAGVMEGWSNGVVKKPIQVEIQVFALANTPILQHSSTPKRLAVLTREAIERKPGLK